MAYPTTLALITVLPLPPTPRSRAFQPLDFVTVAFLLPATLLICGVVNRGRLAWWADTPWLGVDLAIAFGLLTVAVAMDGKGRIVSPPQVRALGLPALTVDWGTWDEMRVASAEERTTVAAGSWSRKRTSIRPGLGSSRPLRNRCRRRGNRRRRCRP